MSYINREKLLEKLHNENVHSEKPNDRVKFWNAAIGRAIVIVQQRPAAPIKRRYKARKIETTHNDYEEWTMLTMVHCEWCRKPIKDDYIYCPYCGAKLEG